MQCPGNSVKNIPFQSTAKGAGLTEHEYEEGDEPWARRQGNKDGKVQDFPCPYCGKKAVLISYGDIPEDDLRIELYCDNTWCEVRTFTIVALRTDRLLQNHRTDVAALHEVDEGTDEERVPSMVNFADREQMAQVFKHRGETLSRRLRPTKVTITPHG